ncbi:MAG: hybrid sensor histidine kinase/response regulator [Candidatus Eremiobacteraeota bacterium]|nr:hybrid sensor histidine kinase/response regulator [Candidatus Eremiobacteraeota bacterium]
MKRIVVIDDEEASRETVMRILKSEGYTVETAENGWEGLLAIRAHYPGLIICDIAMPIMDGYEVLRELRSDPLTATIPFIFFTAQEMMSSARHDMALGADDYLTKPFTADELLKAIAFQETKQNALMKKFQEKIDHLQSYVTRSLPHELRTPLSGIMGASSLIRDSHKSLSEDELKTMIELIYTSAERLNRFIQNYLQFAQLAITAQNPVRLEALRKSRSELLRGKGIPSEAVISRTASEIAQEAARERDLNLVLSAAAIEILEEDLSKIVKELVDNAFKYSRTGTPVHVKSVSENNRFVLSVTDHGRGMTAGQIARIGAYMQFERDTYEQQGVGLGLEIARCLIETYEGELNIESIPGQETTVHLSLVIM